MRSCFNTFFNTFCATKVVFIRNQTKYFRNFLYCLLPDYQYFTIVLLIATPCVSSCCGESSHPDLIKTLIINRLSRFFVFIRIAQKLLKNGLNSHLNTKTMKHALSKSDIKKIMQADCTDKTPIRQLAQDLFAFSYLCGGISFVDIANLTSKNIIDNRLIYQRQKTHVGINLQFSEEARKPLGINAPILVSQKGTIFTVQRINVILKEVKRKYRLHVGNFSCHSLRKTFGRQVYTMNNNNAELALVKLMELFNHSNVAITKRYLGLRQEEILETYDCLSF